MSTTTIRIEEDLKARVTAAAERAGKSTHAFILDAITQTLEQAEYEDELHHIADERWATVMATGQTISWDEAKRYLEARARGEKPRSPTVRKPGRR